MQISVESSERDNLTLLFDFIYNIVGKPSIQDKLVGEQLSSGTGCQWGKTHRHGRTEFNRGPVFHPKRLMMARA
jgi:hypothetical protein